MATSAKKKSPKTHAKPKSSAKKKSHPKPARPAKKKAMAKTTKKPAAQKGKTPKANGAPKKFGPANASHEILANKNNKQLRAYWQLSGGKRP